MEALTTWPWGTIWQAIGALAAVLALIYAPYAVLWNALRADNKETRQKMDKGFADMRVSMETGFAEIRAEFRGAGKHRLDLDKRLAVVEDRAGVTFPRPEMPDPDNVGK
ncbi:MAG: hypothetical protein F4Y00_01285 [Bacteroidetes bacterium SB0662_bin_6]|nr:hypothetical protein [Bacteroidetes bacterium SB0668_bin_1]MYE03599.1 hypothetical protein [Bacteroidetes bacterium SB0662_bin_6]